MKFFVSAVVLLAVFICCQAIVVPLGVNTPLLYSTAYGPRLVMEHSDPIVLNAPSVSIIPFTTHLYRAPLIVPVGMNNEATYTAKTLGSEHVATLPGHSKFASSLNLEKAPGSKDSSYLQPSVAIHPLIVQSPLLISTEAKYVAKNLGVEHVAPLPGHTISATSLNLQPTPGSN